MIEQRRHQYLASLGIDQYIPGRVLSGAAASAALVEVEYDTHSVEQNTDIDIPAVNEASPAGNHIDTASVSSLPSPADLLKDPVQPPDARVIAPTVETTVSNSEQVQAQPASDKIRFVLTVWRISADLLVIDSRQPAAALPTDRLLQNMLRVVGHPLAQLPQSEIIRWPLFANVVAADDPMADAAEARAMVQAYITAQMAKSPLKALLLMGKAATEYSVDISLDFDQQLGQSIFHEAWQLNVIVTPSLKTMLEEPLQKKLAWQALSQHLS